MNNSAPKVSLLEWSKGDRLYRSLRISGVTHAEMADELGVSRNTIGNYIADRTPIKDGMLRVWAMRTGVPFRELRDGIDSNGYGPNGPDNGMVNTAPSDYIAPVTDISAAAKARPSAHSLATAPTTGALAA